MDDVIEKNVAHKSEYLLHFILWSVQLIWWSYFEYRHATPVKQWLDAGLQQPFVHDIRFVCLDAIFLSRKKVARVGFFFRRASCWVKPVNKWNIETTIYWRIFTWNSMQVSNVFKDMLIAFCSSVFFPVVLLIFFRYMLNLESYICLANIHSTHHVTFDSNSKLLQTISANKLDFIHANLCKISQFF